MMIILVGCNERMLPEDTPTALAIIIGNHSNSVGYNIHITEKLKSVYSNFGNVCIISVDGEPEVLRDSKGNIIGCYDSEYIENSKNKYIHKEIWERDYLNKQIAIVEQAIDNCLADDEEVDTLKALQIAVNTLTTIEGMMSQEVKKEIILFDTGLCTSGSLSFMSKELQSILCQNNIRNGNETEKIIEKLDIHMNIPELSNITITWYGLGQIAPPQPELSNINIYNLNYIWGEILETAGAVPSKINGTDEEYGIFVFADENITANKSDYFVTPIVFWNEYAEDKTSIKLDEKTIKFKGDLDVYVSESEARTVLKPYAENLKNNPNIDILLCGTTSSINGGSLYLSESRAKRVKETLVEFGIPSERIKAVGIGYNIILCENDSPNGQFLEELGKNNRAVHIIPLESDLAKEILSIH